MNGKWLCIAVWCAAGAAWAQPVEVRATLEPAAAPFYRPAILIVSVTAPGGLAVNIPDLPKQQDLEVSAAAPSVNPLEDGRQRVERRFTLDAVRDRAYLVPPLDITYGDGQHAATLPLVFDARPISEEEAQAVAEQIASPLGPDAFLPARPLPWPLWLGITAGVALLVAGAIYGVMRWRRYRNAPAPPLQAWEVARQRLRALAMRQLPQAGRFEIYYVDLSAILRYYIEDRFDVHAIEQTTQEFLAEAGKSGHFTEEQQKGLARFLRHCDKVKFARYQPSAEQMEQSFQLVAAFIEETVPRLDTTEKEAAA